MSDPSVEIPPATIQQYVGCVCIAVMQSCSHVHLAVMQRVDQLEGPDILCCLNLIAGFFSLVSTSVVADYVAFLALSAALPWQAPAFPMPRRRLCRGRHSPRRQWCSLDRTAPTRWGAKWSNVF